MLIGQIRRILVNKALRFYSSTPELTTAHYPHIKRGDYNTISDHDLSVFERVLGGRERIITDQSDLQAYNTDWVENSRGSSEVALRPKTTEEVAAILKHCNERKLAVCPQGGNTGLAGGSIPVFDEVIITTGLMNKIINFDQTSGILECQAGCVLENLDQYLNQHGFIVPLDLGAKGSCQIGGNVSTNAGGLRLLRYGSLHENVLGVEAVLADGTILDCMSNMRKNNTGYDMRQLFIGSEGTLGLVTRVALLCKPCPSSINVALFGCQTFEDVINLYIEARRQLGEVVSSCEFFDAESYELVKKHLGLHSPIKESPFYFLLETSGSSAAHDTEKLHQLLEKISDKEGILDGTLATDGTKIKEIWALRERIGDTLACYGYVYKYDVSLPLNEFYNLVLEMRSHLGNKVVIGFGHIGDGNLHLIVMCDTFDHDLLGSIEPYIYERVAARQGSISAEHGLGLEKKDYIYYSRSVETVRKMAQLKQLFDPKGILNPYKLLPTVVK